MMMRERKEIPKRTANCSVCKIINNLQCVKRRAWNIEALKWKNYTPEAFGFISFPFIARNGVGGWLYWCWLVDYKISWPYLFFTISMGLCLVFFCGQ